MRISFVIASDNLAGGTRVVAMYAEYLRRRGHQVLVVSVPPQSLPISKTHQITSYRRRVAHQ